LNSELGMRNSERKKEDRVLNSELGMRNSERKKKRVFRLRKATFKGNGLKSDALAASWEKIREMSYEGRGG
jgi:hypothetical protein